MSGSQTGVAGTTSLAKRPGGALRVLTTSPARTRQLGRTLGQWLEPGHLVLLAGPFGAGKTCLVQGLAAGAGVPDPVKSPSFTLVNEYRSGKRFPFYHVDLYRVEGPEDVASLGLDEYLSGEGVCVVEWADRARHALPGECLEIAAELGLGSQRLFTFCPRGAGYDHLVARLAEALGCS